MKYKSISLIIGSVLIILTLYSSCKKESSFNIIGSYSRSQVYGANSFQVKLTFSENNVMKWEPIDSIPGHTATTLNYNIAGEVIHIYGDNDCGSEAYYFFNLSGTNLNISLQTDDCTPRTTAMCGLWTLL
ncbi:MAG: hypothetical protein ACOYN4_10605 [Bacteroidales bacterium]